MMFIELFIPKGTLSEEQRRHLCQRLLTELMAVDEYAPATVIEDGLALSQVVVHEPEQWIVGRQALGAADPPRFVVRASVPGAWRREMSEHLITTLTRVLAEADDNPQRFYQEPHAWVYVVGIPEGGSGAFGQVMKSQDILKLITKSYREAPAGSQPDRDLPPDTGVDPICGMYAPLSGDDAITLEHDGTTYAFCSAGCRALFIEELHDMAIE